MFVVATEQLCGKRGMPTAQFSRSSTSILRNEPAFRGMSAGKLLKTPVTALFVAVASERLRPFAMQSTLCRRSTRIRSSFGSTSTIARTGIPSGSSGGSGSCVLSLSSRAAGSARIAWRMRRSE
jgi:hypothetical protein